MSLQIDRDRLWASLMSMAEVGATTHGGCNRQALTEQDRLGRNLFVSWCQQAGCTIEVDTMGNIFARRSGMHAGMPAVATGSHLDTQPSGGKFDGILGVLAGLEIIRTLNDHNVATDKAIEVVNWTNEEGSRFAPPTMASSVYAQDISLAHAHSATDAQGTRFGEALKSIDYLGQTECGKRDWDSFFELHIEQGPVLENAHKTIGVVTRAQGLRWFECRVRGQSSHAGTTPMTLRKDALAVACQLVEAIHQIALDNAPHAVATVGEFNVFPGSPNVIPGAVDFSIDLRHPSAEQLNGLSQAIKALFKKLNNSEYVTAEVRETFASSPVEFDSSCVQAVALAADQLGFSSMNMVSGATHDALKVASVTPTAMIFVPSENGISHNELEWTSPEDCAAGANVLMHALLSRAAG